MELHLMLYQLNVMIALANVYQLLLLNSFLNVGDTALCLAIKDLVNIKKIKIINKKKTMQIKESIFLNICIYNIKYHLLVTNSVLR